MNNKKKMVLAIAVMAVFILAMAGAYLRFGPQAQSGAKTVTIEVIDDKGESTVYKIHTDAEYLLDALKDAEREGLTFHGQEGDFGMSVDTVNGLQADFYTGNAYWAFSVNDKYCNYGPSEQTVADGDVFKVVYTVYKE